MRRPARRLAALLAASWLAAACGSPPDPYATIAQVRGPWRAQPLALAPSAVAAVEEACAEARPALANGAQANRLAAIDARGTGRITAIYAGAGSAFMRCELRMTGSGDLEMAGGWAQSTEGRQLLLDQDDLTIETSGGMLGGEGLASNASGRIGAAISAVRLVFASGTVVHASLGGGWFSAWWPTDDVDFVVEAYDASGRKIAEVER